MKTPTFFYNVILLTLAALVNYLPTNNGDPGWSIASSIFGVLRKVSWFPHYVPFSLNHSALPLPPPSLPPPKVSLLIRRLQPTLFFEKNGSLCFPFQTNVSANPPAFWVISSTYLMRGAIVGKCLLTRLFYPAPTISQELSASRLTSSLSLLPLLPTQSTANLTPDPSL